MRLLTIHSLGLFVHTNQIPILHLDLDVVKERNIEDLSGGELQRFACAVLCVQNADV